jgi:hypothetical protein
MREDYSTPCDKYRQVYRREGIFRLGDYNNHEWSPEERPHTRCNHEASRADSAEGLCLLRTGTDDAEIISMIWRGVIRRSHQHKRCRSESFLRTQ